MGVFFVNGDLINTQASITSPADIVINNWVQCEGGAANLKVKYSLESAESQRMTAQKTGLSLFPAVLP